MAADGRSGGGAWGDSCPELAAIPDAGGGEIQAQGCLRGDGRRGFRGKGIDEAIAELGQSFCERKQA